MKLIKTLGIIFCFATLSGQNNTILKIDNQTVNKAEFEQIYWKNKKEKIATKEDLDEYIKLFVNFKLKVIAAEELGLDTTKKFINELSGYRVQLEKPYLIDTSINEDLINEAYYRTINEVNASHIMTKLGPNPSPEDTLKAYNKILDIRNKIISGNIGFEEAAEELSEDPYAKSSKGNLGYFNAFKMLYSFECAAYETPVGKVSEIVRTKYGYHIVKPNSIRKAKGRVKTSHIMITTSSKKENILSEEKINSIYKELVEKTKTFEELAIQYSEDRKSAKNGGEIGWINSGGNFYPEFEEAVFSLKTDGEYSKPFKTPNGWHIVKRLSYEPIGDLKSMRYNLKNKIQKDARAQKTKSSFINKLKTEYQLKNMFNIKVLVSILKNKKFDYENLDFNNNLKNINNVVLTFSNVSFTNFDFIKYLGKSKLISKDKIEENLIKQQFVKFTNQNLIEFEKTQLETKHPDFKALMKEYRDGILLFEISDQNIWTKAIKDTAGLKEFYNSNKDTWKWPNRINGTLFTSESKKTVNKVKSLKLKKSLSNDSIMSILNKDNLFNLKYENKIIDNFNKYNLTFDDLEKGFNGPFKFQEKWVLIYVEDKLPQRNKELKEAEGIIVSAYQNYLESQWLSSLKEKHEISINYETLYSIKQKP
ncbi:MAG: peptidylprolyl isomerase [Flavobacteriales bacterium]